MHQQRAGDFGKPGHRPADRAGLQRSCAGERRRAVAFQINLWQNIQGSDDVRRLPPCRAASRRSSRAPTTSISPTRRPILSSICTNPSAVGDGAEGSGGHNCWLASPQACGATLTVWIQNWAGSTAVGLAADPAVAPPEQDVGPSKTFPTSSGAIRSAHLAADARAVLLALPLGQRADAAVAVLRQRQSVDEAYADAQAKINLINPAQSRFVVRLATEFHHCWSRIAQPNAATMQPAITAFANGIPTTQVDPTLIVSKQLSLYQGTVASGQNRYTTRRSRSTSSRPAPARSPMTRAACSRSLI